MYKKEDRTLSIKIMVIKRVVHTKNGVGDLVGGVKKMMSEVITIC